MATTSQVQLTQVSTFKSRGLLDSQSGKREYLNSRNMRVEPNSKLLNQLGIIPSYKEIKFDNGLLVSYFEYPYEKSGCSSCQIEVIEPKGLQNWQTNSTQNSKGLDKAARNQCQSNLIKKIQQTFSKSLPKSSEKTQKNQNQVLVDQTQQIALLKKEVEDLKSESDWQKRKIDKLERALSKAESDMESNLSQQEYKHERDLILTRHDH